jgi:hypothetical protein
MKARKFNSLMPYNNERWAAKALNMQVNSSQGPDLIDKTKVVEVKFKIIYPNEYMHISWRVLEYQMNYDKNKDEKDAYWGLGTYLFQKHISKIKIENPKNLEAHVLERSLTIVPWDWMNQFPAYHQTGKTKKSEWDNTLRFPKASLLPKITQEYKVSGGKIRISEGVDYKKFQINTTNNQL